MKPDKNKDYSKIDKIALELGLVKTTHGGMYETKPTYVGNNFHRAGRLIDLTASAEDLKSIAKNIISQI